MTRLFLRLSFRSAFAICLFGACDLVEGGNGDEVDIVYGCPGVVIQ